MIVFTYQAGYADMLKRVVMNCTLEDDPRFWGCEDCCGSVLEFGPNYYLGFGLNIGPGLWPELGL